MLWAQTVIDATKGKHSTMHFAPLPFAVHQRVKKFIRNIFIPEDVFGAQNFSLFIFSFSGLVSWKSAGPDKGRRRLHIILRLLTMTVQCLGYLVSLLMTLHREENFISFFFENDVSEVTSLIELIIAMLAVTVIYSMFYVRRRNYRRLFKMLHEVDQKFKELGGSARKVRDFRTTVFFSVKLMMSTFTLLGVYVIASYAIQWGKEQMAHMFAWFSYFWPQFIFAMAVNLAVNIMWQLGERFEQLNRVSWSWQTIF